ncbi:hypothetical protein HS1genome_0159 [Sulfodiicoccus acidiphilus]|uniref:Sulfocyanin n=1 Tax=Sulfodiicoccus acidiphilus TaxID=1670455 RepID=A0A348B0R8_9CREN|nr:sulfocyanin [Sulfodiicoccus acidiphilus]BBD71770.1 hypothetical protein HS1genome_0159 [Sulfodiicoccus acidiphilus]GGT99113.1 hypothetical protein GCM10007116_15540 [Sulfodiicoccus acidiphilus]
MSKGLSSFVIIAIVVVVVLAAVGGALIVSHMHGSGTIPSPKPQNTTNSNTTAKNVSSPSSNLTISVPGTPLPYSKATNTVYITLIAEDISQPFNLNGTSDGKMVIYVPTGANLNITFVNEQSLPHNLNLVMNNTPIPNSADIGLNGKILFQLGTNMSSYQYSGIMNGQSVNGVYKDIQAGYYWLCCGIDTHAESGMWIVVVASSNVSAPYVIVN